VTFASKTIIPGDKSSVNVAIHELTHSFFGNDVGCRNWDNFWLNEGLNTFMERKTLEIMRGSDVAIMDYHNGNDKLYDTVLDYGINNSYSSLFPKISLDDPENSFSEVPYEKGSQFLYFIETLIGEDLMPALMKQYLTTFSQMAIGQDDFRRLYEDFVESNFDAAESSSIINRTAWDKWVLEPGMPPVTLNFTSSLLDGAVALASSYLALEGESGPTNYMEYFNFTAAQKSAFVRELQDVGNRTTVELLELVDNQLALTNSTTNAYVKTQWYQLGIE
jgi:leukotriene-A4 hydrolase